MAPKKQQYERVSLPRSLVEDIDRLISKEVGYTSRADFARDAVRRSLERLGGKKFKK